MDRTSVLLACSPCPGHGEITNADTLECLHACCCGGVCVCVCVCVVVCVGVLLCGVCVCVCVCVCLSMCARVRNVDLSRETPLLIRPVLPAPQLSPSSNKQQCSSFDFMP